MFAFELAPVITDVYNIVVWSPYTKKSSVELLD
jgi:hypothetical protein